MKLTQSELRAYLHYEPSTGDFFKRVRTNGVEQLVRVSGSTDSYGYKQIRVNGKKYLAHRIAWLYVHGPLAMSIDHVNGVRSDNRISNLRLATQAENLQNQRVAQKGSKSGALGVSWDASAKKWRARITLRGRLTEIGRFSDLGDASAAYIGAKRRLHAFSTI